jgi:hypothetical protein
VTTNEVEERSDAAQLDAQRRAGAATRGVHVVRQYDIGHLGNTTGISAKGLMQV